MVKAKRRRGVVVIDMAHTLDQIRARGQEDFWAARDHHGFFDHVWGVHPLADVVEPSQRRVVRKFSANQLVIEGKSQRLPLPAFLLPVNLILSQALLLLWLWRKLLRRPEIRVIYAADPLYCGLFGLCLARLLKRPLVVFIPANYDELWENSGVLAYPRLFRTRGVEQKVMRLVFSRADMVVAVAGTVFDMARRYGTPQDRIMRGRHGKFIGRAHRRSLEERASASTMNSLNIPPADNYLLYVSRLIELKLPFDAVKAMITILHQRPGTIAIVVGQGDCRPQLETMVAQAGLSDRFVFTGQVTQDVLADLYAASITLSPLTGMALIEAALGGSPIVAYDRDFQAEFLSHEESGIIVPAGDVEAMAEAVIRMIDEPDRRRRIQVAARRTALSFIDPVLNGKAEWIAMTQLIANGVHADHRFEEQMKLEDA